jgi:hypothetical protein
MGNRAPLWPRFEWHSGELYPRAGFIVTNMSMTGEVGGYVLQSTQRGEPVDQGRQESVRWTRLSCDN